jgi:hypothetical protein
VKARVFEVMLHKQPSGRSPGLRVVATHLNTVVAPAGPNAMPSSEESTSIIFCTVFFTE